jgi:hypothetical protein
MKYVITEQQQIGILYSVLDDMFSDFETNVAYNTGKAVNMVKHRQTA